MVVRLRDCDDSATTTVPQNIEYMLPGNILYIIIINVKILIFCYLYKIYIDEQMKRLAQQEYNNMLEELQEDDNVDDDGENFNNIIIVFILYKYQLINFLLILMF